MNWKGELIMGSDIHIGKDLSGKDVFVPRVDETPVPCPDGYMSSDCLYLSNKVCFDYFGISENSPLTELLNEIINGQKRLDKQNRDLCNTIKRLEEKIEDLEKYKEKVNC